MLSFSSVAEVKKYISKHEIEFVSLYLSDIDGRLRNVTIPVDSFGEKAVDVGVGFDASNFGFADVNRSDMILRPDLSFAFEDPVDPESKVLYFFCHMLEMGGQKNFGQDLRHIVRESVSALKAEGIADEVRVGVELEFNVLDELNSIMTPRRTAYGVESSELPNPSDGDEFYRIYNDRGYFRAEPNDHLFEIRNEIVSALTKIGMEVKYHHHEVGSSQAEIEFNLLPIEFMADATVLAKNICHRIARKHGKVITFIPKLMPGAAGNGMHVHQYLLKDGVNIFNDENGLYKLSKTALSFIGGILTHASSLLAFTNPTSNSYRRLIPGFEAPVKAVFAEGNRSAAIRIPGYVTDPAERRFEFRTIDATCNPYLAYAAMMMAGLDGIRSGIDPTKEGFGPYETNLYELPKEELDRIKSFPSSLEKAMEALGQDQEYLLYREVFPKQLIDKWIDTKMKDVYDMRQVPHPWEIARYYDI
jgi:glutamine synthetase